ncbi:hypothetical protein [Clostridium sp. KNHs214]|uniref:hypothetical protein n=1 Tax=Clostridium sp. KNHs214 TaxID=1540257 RepID=UPI000554033B|nr:hypothetical protein [Clostridium sp. KNHs214]
MNNFWSDIRECLKISIKILLISFLIGILIGLIGSVIKGSFNILYIAEWGGRFVTYASCFGLFMSAVSFTKKDLMRPLNYEKQWKTYFLKFNLAQAIFFVSIFCLTFSLIINSVLFYLK